MTLVYGVGINICGNESVTMAIKTITHKLTYSKHLNQKLI
jgi:hypothetical protein